MAGFPKRTATLATLVLLGAFTAPARSQVPTSPLNRNGPLIQLHSVGISVTRSTADGAVVGRDFEARQITIFRHRNVVEVLAVNDLTDPDPSAADVFFGRGSEASMRVLGAALSRARIGREQGGCRVTFLRVPPVDPTPIEQTVSHDYEVIWFGRAGRRNAFRIDSRAAEACSLELELALLTILEYPRRARDAAAQQPAPLQPLIQLSSSGVTRELIVVGFLEPIIIEYFEARQIAIFRDRGFAAVVVSGAAGEPLSYFSSVASGRLAEPAFDSILRALSAAEIGAEEGACSAEITLGPFFDPFARQVSFNHDYRITWHGRGNRIRSFAVDSTAAEACSEELRAAILEILRAGDHAE